MNRITTTTGTTTTAAHGSTRRRRLAATLAALVGLATAAPVLGGHAAAAPPLGSTPWAVLLCKAQDVPAEPHDPSYYRHQFAEHDSVNPTTWDFWWTQSNYRINLIYTTVSSHWITTGKTVAQLQQESRRQKLQDCMDAAGYEVANASSDYGVLAMWNTDFTLPTDTANYGDSGAVAIGPTTATLAGTTQPYAGVVVEPWAAFPSFFEHEMGHGYGLTHAFGNVACGAIAGSGEYCDPYDTMGVSWGGYEVRQPVYANEGGSRAEAGPGLGAFDLEQLGFLPAGREAVVGAAPGQVSTVTVTSLSAPNATGYLTVKVPLAADHWITVEMRRRAGFDQGINADGVVIHEVKSSSSYLVDRSSNWADGVWTAGQSTTIAGVMVQVVGVDLAANTATVTISGPAPAPAPSPVGIGNSPGTGGCGPAGCGQRHPIHFM